MRFLVPLVAALVPLVVTPGFVSHFDVTPKVAVLLMGTALVLSYRRANVQNIYNLLRQPAGHWFAGILGAIWLCAAIAIAFSTHPLLSLDGSGWRRMGLIPETALLLFALLAAGWLVAELGNMRLLLRACVASGVVAAAYGIAQYFGWDPLLPVNAYQVGEGQYMIVRPPGTLGHADYFAAWEVTIVFLALALERLETQRWLKQSARAASALAALSIVLSGTRSAILGVVMGGLALMVIRRPSVKRATIFAAAIVAALVLLFVSPAGLRLRARLHWSLEDVRGGARLLLWRDTLAMTVRRPVSGYGLETFATEFPRFQSADLARAFPDFYHESPHNMFLDTLASAGLAGFFALLWLCGFGVWCALRSARSRRPLAGSLAAALIGLLVAQQFIVFIVPTLLSFFLILAMLVADDSPELELTAYTPRPSAIQFVAAVVAILLFAFYTFRLLAADRALQVAEHAASTGDVREAAGAYQSLLRWQLPGSGDDLTYSRAMHRLAISTSDLATAVVARQQATEAATRAVTTAEDRQNAWYNLAMLKAESNDVLGVELALRNSIASAPNWFKPRWTLAQVLALTHHPNEALTEATLAMQLDGGHDAEVINTWKTLKTKAGQAP